jgi:RimJ/RimL family protein N-acetyltransferase
MTRAIDGLVVRPVHPGDFDDLRETYFRLYEERDSGEPIGITLFTTRPSLEDEVAWFDRSFGRFSAGDSIFLVAEKDGHAVGSCVIDRASATPTSESAHVGELGILVRKEFRSQGVGTALLEAALERARRTFDVVYLTVFSVNEGAQRLYRRFGFTVCGHLPRAVKRGGRYFDEDRMVLLFEMDPERPQANR